MKKTIAALGAALFMAAAPAISAQEQLLAFPGAEGFGRYTKGARVVENPEIYHVTNLDDSGPGSLRDAVSRAGRIVVFDVSGVIKLKSTLVFKGSSTILGQTAPGEGIQVYGNRVSFSSASQLIVRHMRFRMGINGDSGKDAAGVADGHDMIFDHLSVLWGRDENFSISSNDKSQGPVNITIQNSIIGQGLQSHSCGGLIQSDGGVTLYRNLYIENKTRNPKVKGLNQYVNNVVYNWGDGGCYIMSGSEGDSWADIENNYFINGPWKGAKAPFTRGTPTFRYYGAGNYHDKDKDGTLNGNLMTVEEMKGESSDGIAPYSTWFASLDALNQEIDSYNAANSRAIAHIPEIVGKMSAAEALAWVEQYVGPVLPARDEVDQYLIDELTSYGTKGTINGISSEAQLPHKGTGTLSGGVKPLDSDGDGIPDAWETANGLNPNDASDAAAIAANGYTNIENFANSITEAFPYIKKPVKLAVTRQAKTEIDLTWELNNNTTAGFIIELSADNGSNYAEVARVAAGTTSATLTGLTPETDYKVRIRAYNADGIYSDYSNVVACETIGDPSAPKLSENPFPANGSRQGIAGGLTLTWANATKPYFGTVKYNVYLGESADAMAAVATDLTATEYVTSGLVANKTYYWRVDATNEIGTTEGSVWSFSTTEGGVLFYTDFYKQPEAWFEKYGSITANTNIYNTKNSSVTVAGMTVGSGDNTIRIIAMNGANNAASTSSDYGPATDDDAGASDRCLQFYTTASGGYLYTPEVSGPCVLTLWLGNPDAKSKTVKLYTKAGGEETLVQDMALGSKKRVYKFTYTYMGSGTVQFKIDNNAVKFNINDILIERYVTPSGKDPLELTSGNLDNENMSYADGSLTLTFNQDVLYKGGAKIQGKTQYETINISASGKKVTLAYEALDANAEYAVVFPAGSITDATGEQSYACTVKMNTCDWPALKQDGETHYGKAAASLPLNMAPFTEVAPFATVGGLTQTSEKDYPHWVQASGEVTAEYATLTSTSDKIMTYFEPQSKQVGLMIDYEGTGSPRLKVQESRNCDIAPGWRTIRVLEKADFPFHGQFDLDPETHFIKLAPVTIGGALKVKAFTVSDADGNFSEGYEVSLGKIAADNATVVATGHEITVSGISAATPVSVFDLSGRLVGSAKGEATFSLSKGLYIVSIHGVKTVKVML